MEIIHLLTGLIIAVTGLLIAFTGLIAVLVRFSNRLNFYNRKLTHIHNGLTAKNTQLTADAAKAQGKVEVLETKAPDARKRVLVVDDHPDTVSLFSMLLTHSGYAVGTAESGVVAIMKVQAFRPDLILLDLNLPGMRGTDVLKWVVQITNAPVVFCSSPEYLSALTPEEMTHVVGTLPKPVEPEQLLLVVGGYFRLSTASAPL